jgi:CheY-like chemotaxis protein
MPEPGRVLSSTTISSTQATHPLFRTDQGWQRSRRMDARLSRLWHGCQARRLDVILLDILMPEMTVTRFWLCQITATPASVRSS